ncbi:MAG: hypothetical protein HY080_05060 [Gammaproteobacteria bacterium]|nr:hypothetical protein [Gammaproteobacteria bacterium]
MTVNRLFVFSVYLFAAACMAGNPENPWVGEYKYFASGGQTAGGSQIMVDITLKIDNQGNKASCQLNADGFQRYDRILCTTTLDNNQLTVHFKSYGDGSVVNPIGVDVYKVGETLFALEKKINPDKQKPARFIPHWGTYSPFGTEDKNPTEYFEKVK